MSGTPSRTATACPKGPVCELAQGRVGRKPKANRRSEEHKSHTRHCSMGERTLVLEAPWHPGRSNVYAAMAMGRSRVLPGEIFVPVPAKTVTEIGRGRTEPECPGYGRVHVCRVRGAKGIRGDRGGGTNRIGRGGERGREVSRGHCSRVQATKGRTMEVCFVPEFRVPPGGRRAGERSCATQGGKWRNHPWPWACPVGTARRIT